MVKLFGYFYYFIKKDLIKYDMKTIKMLFFNGMNASALTSKYSENMEEELVMNSIQSIYNQKRKVLSSFQRNNRNLSTKKRC